MRLAVLGPTYPYRGGISHHTTLLVDHLRSRHTVEFLSFTRQYPSFLFPGRSDRDPSQHSLQVPCRYTLDSMNPITWLRTARYIQDSGAAWLILPWWVPFWGLPFFTVARLIRQVGMRVLFLCHNVVPHEGSFWAQQLTCLALSQGQVFIAQSPRDEKLLREYFPERLIYRTVHPIYDMFATQLLPKNKARVCLALDPTISTILFFGFVRPYKGLHYLLEAMALVCQEMKIHLLIVGEFWDEKTEYLRQIQRLGLETNVTIIDQYIPNEQVGTYFSAADVVVLPYLETSQSGVMQLAFGFNKPVITTQPVALAETEVVIHPKLIVPSGNSHALATAIRTFFTQLPDYTPSLNYASSWTALIDALEAGIATYDQT